ncbi:MAG: hypothetical protein ACQESF_00330 [Nanobdellota archaeon]
MVDKNIDEKTVFIKLSDYKESLSRFEKLKTKISQAKETLQKIESLKQEENTEIELWNDSIKDIESKLEYIDSLMVDEDK